MVHYSLFVSLSLVVYTLYFSTSALIRRDDTVSPVQTDCLSDVEVDHLRLRDALHVFYRHRCAGSRKHSCFSIITLPPKYTYVSRSVSLNKKCTGRLSSPESRCPRNRTRKKRCCRHCAFCEGVAEAILEGFRFRVSRSIIIDMRQRRHAVKTSESGAACKFPRTFSLTV